MTAPVIVPNDGVVPDAPGLKNVNGTNGVNMSNGTNGLKPEEKLRTQTNGHSYQPKSFSIPLNTEYAYKPRKLRVVTIGAGFSGLLMAHKIQHRFPELQEFVDHTIYEARSDVGGTWLINNYPGVQCDVPSHIYAFPFDPNPNWSRFYSSGEEIEEYIKSTVRKWNLDRDIQLNTKVVGAVWDENVGRWNLTVEHNGQQRSDSCDILISAQGVLVHHSWPDIPGLHDFKGHITHSAHWDHSFDYSNKRIAVIGNGSSGIQITPQMAKLPGTEVVNFMRSPAWVYYRVPPSKHLGRDVEDANPAYSEEEISRFNDPEAHKEYRKGIISRTNKAFRLFIKGENNEAAVKFGAQQMAEKLNHDPDLCEKLIPKWEVGCRRVTPGPGYLEAFAKPNCNLSNSRITKITENAVHTEDGNVFECDVVVCATGFDVSHRPHYPIVGQNGLDLAGKWADEPESYLSVATSSFPNYFIMMGPNCLGGHGSLVESLNWTGDYFVKWIKKIATEDIKYVVPKESVEQAFGKYGDEIHKTLVWTGGCKSWYKRNRVDGRVTALFGGSAILFHRMISDIRAEDFNIEEQVHIEHVKKDLGHKRVWAVGPVLPIQSGSAKPEEHGGNSAVSRNDIVEWLDSCGECSVVYVCFGSRTILTSSQMEVLTRALDLSGVNFVLSVGVPDARAVAQEQGKVPCGFMDRVGVRGRGFLIEGWAPQLVILSHRAVGAFLTHCGWNSVLEGLVSGVVMVTWPMGADQYTNARLLVDELGMGIRGAEGEKLPEAKELGKRIEKALGRTKERVRAEELRDAALRAVGNGGSSERELDEMVKLLNEVPFEKTTT